MDDFQQDDSEGKGFLTENLLRNNFVLHEIHKQQPRCARPFG